MTKHEMIGHLVALYRLGNRAVSDSKPASEAWTHADMAGNAMCAELDAIFAALTERGVLTPDQRDEIYSDL